MHKDEHFLKIELDFLITQCTPSWVMDAMANKNELDRMGQPMYNLQKMASWLHLVMCFDR